MPIASVNPATEEILALFEPDSESALEGKLALAVAAFRAWRKSRFEDRSAVLERAAGILTEEKERWGELLTLEMGKPIGAAIAEVEKCAWLCRYYAEQAERLLASEKVATDAHRSYVRFDPLGPVLAIMPWNFPFWQVFRFAAPALMAGNVGLLKHASNVPQSALAIEEIFRRAGLPEGGFQTLLLAAGRAELLAADPRIAAVTLTGSEAAGSAVARTAGAAIKKTVLELGGSDPFLVFASADLEAAVSTAVRARILNNGQSCIAAKRFLLQRQIADEFSARFVALMAALKVGDPMDPATDLGPLATAAIRDELHRQVEASVAAGAQLLLGGHQLHDRGFFYAPTVLVDPPPACPAAREELFGPVAALFRFDTLAEGIELANATAFGLGASAWTRDPEETSILATEIEAGSVFINGMVKSDPRLPFGGVKRSGYGRELSGYGIREFVNVKTVWIG